jgi:hypothetical protein
MTQWINHNGSSMSPVPADALIIVQYQGNTQDVEGEILLACDVDWDEVKSYLPCKKKQPQECHFGLTSDGITPYLMVSFKHPDGSAYDRFDQELMAVVPSWLPEYQAAECLWEIPANMTKQQVHASMIELGYNYEPEWCEP